MHKKEQLGEIRSFTYYDNKMVIGIVVYLGKFGFTLQELTTKQCFGIPYGQNTNLIAKCNYADSEEITIEQVKKDYPEYFI